MIAFELNSEAFGTFSTFSDRFHDFSPGLDHASAICCTPWMQRQTEEAMRQVNTLGIAAGRMIDAGRETATDAGLPRWALRRSTQGWRRFFEAIGALLWQITSDPQPNSAFYLGTYVPFLDTTQPPLNRNDWGM